MRVNSLHATTGRHKGQILDMLDILVYDRVKPVNRLRPVRTILDDFLEANSLKLRAFEVEKLLGNI